MLVNKTEIKKYACMYSRGVLEITRNLRNKSGGQFS